MQMEDTESGVKRESMIMKKLAAFAFVTVLIASASLASAQSASNQNYFSQMPMFSLWGNQATTNATPMAGIVGAQAQGQTTPVNSNTSLQDFWSLMPMFQLFSFNQQP